MRKALVTGGCGFIGSNLAKELVRLGWQVDIVDNMSSGHIKLVADLKCRFLPGAGFIRAYNLQDLSTNRKQDEVIVIQDDFDSSFILEYISDKHYDVVFHQAAVPRVSYSVEHPEHTTDTNILKTVKLFKACAGNVDRVVFASSSSVYGGAENLPTKESTEKQPKSPYAWQKSAIEDFAKMCWDLYKLDVVCLRYFNVFGPGQYGDSPYSTAVSAWCHAIKNDLELRSDGDGSQSRDMCYVDNAVSANILAANNEATFMGRCYNISCGDRTSNKDILEFLSKNKNLKINHAPWRQGDVMHTQADITRAQIELRYEPCVRFWEGLERTLEWWDIK
jgi:nucleoside-diphosphate-sugar epimerase